MRRSVVCRLAAEVASKPTVTIPHAIKRSPLDLLKALNSTVGTDKTAPHFAFIDDPTTIPSTAGQKRSYFLAKELGKRAARQLAEEWPTLMAFDRDLPRLPAFRPEKPLDPLEVEPTEANLRKLVEAKQVSAAARLYERLQSGDVALSADLQEALFRLVVYYNGQDVPLLEIEEWPGLRNLYDEGATKWNDAGLADLLFESVEKNAENSSTMIAGLCKFRSDVSVVRAKAIYKELLAKNLVPSEEAFNALLSVSAPAEIVPLLKQMAHSGVAPSVRTFNAALTAVGKGKTPFATQWKTIRQLLGEMKAVAVDPSLTTYSIVLETLVPAHSGKDANQLPAERIQLAVNVLNEVLVRLEMGGTIAIVDASDQYFFLNAIRVAVEANNETLVDRIEKAYADRKNTVALTALTTESVFYSRYLTYKANTLNIDALEKLYKELVPRVVGSNRQLTLKLVDRLSKDQRWSFTQRVVGDSIASRHLVDFGLSSAVRKLLLAQDVTKLSDIEKEQFQTEVTRLVDAVVEFANFTQPFLKRLQVKLNPQAVCECALLLIRAEQPDRAWNLVELLLDDKAKTGDDAIVADFGYAQQSTLYELLEAALADGDWYNASHVVQLVSVYQPKSNLEPIIAKIDSRCKLTPIQRSMLRNFVKLRQ
uniref:PPR_long domain-containing protein n=1 Tax=Panagrellus redivivus TaxID=6233 RepID=A0A7E4VQQ0_PANRE